MFGREVQPKCIKGAGLNLQPNRFQKDVQEIAQPINLQRGPVKVALTSLCLKDKNLAQTLQKVSEKSFKIDEKYRLFFIPFFIKNTVSEFFTFLPSV